MLRRILVFLWTSLAVACASQRAAPQPETAPGPRGDTSTATMAAAAGTATTSAEPTAPPRVISAEDREKAKALLEQGRSVQQEKGEGGAEEALAIYQQAVALDPELVEAYWEMGWSYQHLSRWDDVLAAWSRVRALRPDFPELKVHYPMAVMRRDQERALAELPEPGDLPPPEEKPSAGPRVRFAAVGDVQLGRAWPEERATLPPNDAADLLAAMHGPLQDADVTFGNLETVLADGGDSTKCGPKSTKCFAFRVPTRYANALKTAGFDVMSTANNHAGDFGPEGRVATMGALDQVGLRHSGVIGDIASFEVKGLKVGLVGFSTGGGVYRVQDLDIARKVIAHVARSHDLVVASFHAGAEGAGAAHVPDAPEVFYGEDRGEVRKLARTVIDAGADLVLGHGPHLLRGMEIYRGRLIAYSLGNFSSWETFNITGPLGISVVLYAEVAPNGVLTRAEVLPVVLEKPGRPVPDPKRQAIPILRQLSKEDFGDPLLDEDGKVTRFRP